jgi:hypothetical protein
MTKRYPQDYSKEELVELVGHHHTEHVRASTKYRETLDRLIEAQKKLSIMKNMERLRKEGLADTLD